MSSTLWIFKRFGYKNDLAAEPNNSIAVDKLSPDLQVKSKDHVIISNLHQPSLEDFCNWLKGQADSYDDCFKFPFRGRYEGAGERHNTFFGNFSSRNKQAKFCLMGDEQQHNLSACPNFKALSVEERLSEVQKHKSCFCCLRPGHWLSTCGNLKPCGVNGCTRRHNTLLHSLRNVTPDGNNELKQQHQLTKQHQKQLPHPPSILVHLIKVVVTLFYYKLCLLLCMGQRDTSTHMQC